jgi:GT2 family glycosyltransferase
MSITAVLNLYRRPHTLIQQLSAVQNQSFPPERIIIWKNHAEGVVVPEIPEDLKRNVTIIESSTNFGVWARFTCGLLVGTEYICVFDDDTIPGKFWFENCVHTMTTHCGLLGTIGLRFLKGDDYIHEPRIGWHGPNNNVEQVDIVGHAWFFRQEWTHYLFECLPDYKSMFLVGEDIGFSYILQKHGINTYVPPHPLGNMEMWGSKPDFAMLYGNEPVAISLNPHIYLGFNMALKHYIRKGFVTMNNRV